MVDIIYVIEACPFCVGIFRIGSGIGWNFDVVQAAFLGVFCVSSDCLKVLCTLFGADHSCQDFLALGIILGVVDVKAI